MTVLTAPSRREGPSRRDRRRNGASRVFGPPYPYFDRRALRTPVPGWQLRLDRSAPWRAVAGEVRPLKRVVDVVGAVILLVTLAPLLLAVAAVIKHQGGPILVWQTRVGRRGRCFAAPQFRTTSRFLRDFRLDRLPWLWNVLAGDLSLVGPRPALPREVDWYTPRDLRRLQVAPGLTGLSQVEGGDLPFERQRALDLAYVDRPSLWLDVILLLRTPIAVFSVRGSPLDGAT